MCLDSKLRPLTKPNICPSVSSPHRTSVVTSHQTCHQLFVYGKSANKLQCANKLHGIYFIRDYISAMKVIDLVNIYHM